MNPPGGHADHSPVPSLEIGSVFLARFPEHDPQGREQEGLRPALVVGLPTQVGRPRYPVLILAPVTTYRAQDWQAAAPDLYPILAAGTGGLDLASVVLVETRPARWTPHDWPAIWET